MRHILVKLESNYADEFDVSAFWLTTEREFKDWKVKLAECDISDDSEIYFGTNEFISFDSYKDIIDSLDITYISKELYDDLVGLFGETYGLIDLSDLPNQFEAED